MWYRDDEIVTVFVKGLFLVIALGILMAGMETCVHGNSKSCTCSKEPIDTHG